jgi:hypothetical protein
MRASPAAHPHHLQIKNDHDVVAMRQEVRRVARDLGLGLSQQAKIATAISTIARALLAADCNTTMQMQTADQPPHPALEISCTLPVAQTPEDLSQLAELLHFGEARALVDEAALSLDGRGALLNLRMWLSH